MSRVQGDRPVLEVTDLSVTFRSGARPVRGMALRVHAGETLALVGESGSGKSLTALAVMGLLPAGARAAGSVRLRGRQLLGLRDRELARVRGSGVAMVFQDPMSALTPVHRVGRQVAEAVRAHTPMPARAAAEHAVGLLGRVGVPDPRRRARAYPHELSGGMRQRVMLAMAIAAGPDVIIADEPTTALDPIARARVLGLLRAVCDETGTAVILISHDPAVAGAADRAVTMRDGRAVAHWSGMRPIGGARPGTGRRGTADPARLAGPGPFAGSGSFAPSGPFASSGADSWPGPVAGPGAVGNPRPALLAVEGLVSPLARRDERRGAVPAVDGVRFGVREGETLVLIGESGSGKTSTLREIVRLGRRRDGRVLFAGADTARLGAAGRREFRRNVQIVQQDPEAALDPRMRVGASVAEPLRAHAHPRRDVARRVAELLEMVGLDPALAGRHPQALSGGQRQRVVLARALAVRPKLLLLDEPVAALDVPARAGILDLLERLTDHFGLSCLLVTHDLVTARRLADRVAVMHRGRVVEIGDTRTVLAAPAHPRTRALLDAERAAGRTTPARRVGDVR